MANPRIDENYAKFYGSKQYVKVHHFEFVLAISLPNYPKLTFKKTGDSIPDVGSGDGRN